MDSSRPKRKTDGSAPPVERRSGQDRRKTDALPDGWRDRRRNLEARRPEVAEVDLTASQWAAFDLEPPAPNGPRS